MLTGKYAAIVGPYRLHNFGDDLIGAVIAAQLKHQGFIPTVVGLSKENADWLNIPNSSDRLKTINKSKLVVIGGGGIFGRSGVRKTDEYRKLALKTALYAKALRKRVVITGIGAGPLDTFRSKLLVRIASAAADEIGVRDEESCNFLLGLGVAGPKISQGADLALLLEDSLPIKTQPKKLLGFQFDVKDYLSEYSGSSMLALKATLQSEIRQRQQKTALITNRNYPSQLLEDINPAPFQVRYSSLEKFLNELSSCKAVLTSHLHIAIAAYALRIPCFSIYVREKNERFFKQIGHPERAIHIKDATPTHLKAFIAEMENATWTDFDELRLQELKKEAQKLIELLDNRD